MKICFPPQILDELKKQISKSLSETLHVMFGLDVFQTATPCASKDCACVESHIELENETTKAVLTISIPFDVASKIAANFTQDEKDPTAEIVQEVTHEVANIVVHAVRTYLIQSQGLSLDVKLPRSGRAPDPSEMDVISLFFLIRAEKTIDLDFCYLRSTETA